MFILCIDLLKMKPFHLVFSFLLNDLRCFKMSRIQINVPRCFKLLFSKHFHKMYGEKNWKEIGKLFELCKLCLAKLRDQRQRYKIVAGCACWTTSNDEHSKRMSIRELRRKINKKVQFLHIFERHSLFGMLVSSFLCTVWRVEI